jgi:hypothetical protein
MYITVRSIKRKVGFKGIEATDLIVGLPLFFILLLMFSFSNLRMMAIILFVISVFMFLPINLSKKNRMYKVMVLVGSYLKKNRNYIFFKEERKDGKISGIFKRI